MACHYPHSARRCLRKTYARRAQCVAFKSRRDDLCIDKTTNRPTPFFLFSAARANDPQYVERSGPAPLKTKRKIMCGSCVLYTGHPYGISREPEKRSLFDSEVFVGNDKAFMPLHWAIFAVRAITIWTRYSVSAVKRHKCRAPAAFLKRL